MTFEYCQLCAFSEDCTDEQKEEVVAEMGRTPNNNPLSIYYDPSSCFQSTIEVQLERCYIAKKTYPLMETNIFS